MLLGRLLLLGHAGVSRSSWVTDAWVWTVARCAICYGLLRLGLGSGLVLDRRASWRWEVLLLRVVWGRRVLRLSTAWWWWVVLWLLLLMRGWRVRRWWVGLASRWRCKVLLLTLLLLLVCRVLDMSFVALR